MPALDTEMPTSHSAAASASSSRAAYGAPEAPVIPRKTCIPRDCAPSLLLTLGSFEEDGELAQAFLPERRELRHRRAGIHARRAFQMVHLERDSLVLRPFGGEVGRPEVRRASAEVRVARRTTGNG